MPCLRKIIKRISICSFSLFLLAFFQLSAAASVDSAPLNASATAKNGMVRVYLSSIGSLNKLDITVDGSYSVSGKSTFSLQSGEKISVSMDISNGGLTLFRSGSSVSMGKEFVLRRHQTAGNNGLKIAQTRQSDNLYPGDLYLRSVQSGSSYKLYAIVHVYMEYYLEGVVPYEMGDSANIEALKAQTVAARTYTLSKMNQRKNMSYDVVDTVNDQVYYGNSPNTRNCTNAVAATKGIVLMYNGELASTYYSASNGGQTESALNLWNMTSAPYLTVKNDPFDLLNTSSVARKVNVYRDFSSSLQNSTVKALLISKVSSVLGISDFSILSIDDISPHTAKYSAPSELYTKLDFDVTVQTSYGAQKLTLTFDIFSELEQKLGMNINASQNELWSVDKIGGNFIIYSRRFGHGIGMSQRGAMQMGSMGYTYDQILGFYYPGCYRMQYVMTHTVLSAVSSLSSSVFIQSESPAEITSSSGCTATVSMYDKSGVLAVRHYPDSSSKILTGVVNGGIVSLLSTDGTWAKVKLGEIVGFVPDSCLKFATAPTSSVSLQPTNINQWATVRCSGTLNLRSGSSMTSSVIGQIPSGSILCVFSNSQGWAKVQYGALSGYASCDFLEFASAYPGETSSASGSAFVKAPSAGETVNLRSQSSTSAAVLAVMQDGAALELLSKDSSWCKVAYSGAVGYVMTKYVDFSSSPGNNQSSVPASAPVLVPSPSPAPGENFEEAVVYTISTGLNFRKNSSLSSEIISVIPRSESVAVITHGNDWSQIRYGGAVGYVKTEYLRFTYTAHHSSRAQFVTTPGGPLNMRANASTGSSVIVQIPEGSSVNVFSESGGWSRVQYIEYNGYVMSKFLSDSQQPLGEKTNATVATKNGGLNLRELADASSRVLTIIPAGTRVNAVRQQNGWCKVTYNGINGFVMEKYLSFSAVPATSIVNSTSVVVVVTGNGGLNLRELADSNSKVLAVIPDGTLLDAANSGNGWLKVKYRNMTGYIMSKFTVPSSGVQVTAPPSGTNQTMMVTAPGGVNLRSNPSTSADLLISIPTGEQIEAIDMGEWCFTSYRGHSGYVMKKYIVPYSPKQQSAGEEWQGAETISSFGRAVSLFSSPDDTSDILCRIPDGSSVFVIGQNGNWCRIRWNNYEGYIDSSVLPNISGKNTSSFDFASYATVSTDGGTLNLRQSPSFDSGVIAKLANGTRVSVLQFGNDWCKVEANGNVGWCASSFLVIGE